MPWQLQPIIWPIIIATLALLAMPHKAHPQDCPPDISSAVCEACDGDVRALCPEEYAAGDREKIGDCMKSHAPFVGTPPFVSNRCIKAWLDEHPANDKDLFKRKKK